MFDLGAEPGQRGVNSAGVLAQPTDVFHRDENPVSLGVIELEVLTCRAVGGFQQPRPRVPADPVRGMYNQLAWKEW